MEFNYGNFLRNLKNRSVIKDTGYLPNDEPLFRHLVISEEELDILNKNYIGLEKIANDLKIDFISVTLKGEVDFLHISQLSSFNFIIKNGLKPKNTSYIADLGKGVYAVGIDDEKAIDNIKTYISELCDNDDIVIVNGTYEGEYTRCIYGEGHEGYLVFQGLKGLSADELDNWDTIKIEEFLLEY